MATRDLKLKVGIEGEKEYKQAISEINKGNQVLNSEMQLLQERFKGNEGSMEALTAKSDLLQRQLQQQKDKVATLQEALKNADATFGEADKRTQSWQIQLNNAEKEQIKLERALEETNKELKNNNEHLSEDGKKVAELREKNDVLKKSLSDQKTAIKELREALKESAAQYGKNDDRTKELAERLEKTRNEELEMKRAVNKSNEELKEQIAVASGMKGSLSTLGDQVSGIAEKFGVHLPDSIKGALDNVNGFSTGTVSAMAAAAAGVGAVKVAVEAVTVGIQAAQKLHEITLEQAAWADELLTRSAQTGLDVGTLQGLDYASAFLDFEGIDQSLVKLTDSMGKAVTGADKQAAAFAALGVSVTDTDGHMRDNWEVMLETIDALGQIENETERDLWANTLFGRSYAELKPLIDAGSDSLTEMMEAAKASGYVLSEDQVKTLGEVDDAYQEYQAQIDATKKMLAVEFAPVSTAVMKNFGDFVKGAGQAIVDSGILTSLQGFMEPLGTLLDAGVQLIEYILPLLTPLIDALAEAFKTLAGWIKSAVEWFTSVDWSQAIETTMKDPEINDFDWGTGGVYDWNAAGDYNWRGGLTWVGEAGPEVVELPRGSRIHSAQESGLLAANSGTDTSRLEALLARSVALQEQIAGEFAGLRVKARMA